MKSEARREIRNPKVEIRMLKTPLPGSFEIWNFGFGICFGIRISGFGFPTSHPAALTVGFVEEDGGGAPDI